MAKSSDFKSYKSSGGSWSAHDFDDEIINARANRTYSEEPKGTYYYDSRVKGVATQETINKIDALDEIERQRKSAEAQRKKERMKKLLPSYPLTFIQKQNVPKVNTAFKQVDAAPGADYNAKGYNTHSSPQQLQKEEINKEKTSWFKRMAKGIGDIGSSLFKGSLEGAGSLARIGEAATERNPVNEILQDDEYINVINEIRVKRGLKPIAGDGYNDFFTQAFGATQEGLNNYAGNFNRIDPNNSELWNQTLGVAESMGRMGTQIGASALTGVPTPVIMGGSEAQDYYDQLIGQGYSPNEAAVRAATSGIVEGGSEYVLGGETSKAIITQGIKGLVKKLGKEGAEKTIKQTLGRGIWEFVKDEVLKEGLQEGLTEVAQKISGATLNKVYDDSFSTGQSVEQDLKDIMWATYGGGLMGTVGGGAGKVVNKALSFNRSNSEQNSNRIEEEGSNLFTPEDFEDNGNEEIPNVPIKQAQQGPQSQQSQVERTPQEQLDYNNTLNDTVNQFAKNKREYQGLEEERNRINSEIDALYEIPAKGLAIHKRKLKVEKLDKELQSVEKRMQELDEWEKDLSPEHKQAVLDYVHMENEAQSSADKHEEQVQESVKVPVKEPAAEEKTSYGITQEEIDNLLNIPTTPKYEVSKSIEDIKEGDTFTGADGNDYELGEISSKDNQVVIINKTDGETHIGTLTEARKIKGYEKPVNTSFQAGEDVSINKNRVKIKSIDGNIATLETEDGDKKIHLKDLNKYGNRIYSAAKVNKNEANKESNIENLTSVNGGPKMGAATGFNTSKKSKRASEIFKEFGEKLDVAVKKGKRFSKNVAGTFNNQTYIIKVKKANDIAVLSHETGHMFDRLYDISLTPPTNVKKELEQLGQTTSTRSYAKNRVRREGIAEFVRLYLTNAENLETTAPNTLAYFESKVPGDVIKVLKDFRKDIWDLTNLDAVERVKKSIQFKGDKTKKTPMDPLRKLRQIYTGLFDYTYMAEWAGKELGGKHGNTKMKNLLAKFRGYEGISLYDIFHEQTNLSGDVIGESYEAITGDIHASEEKRRDFWAYSTARRSMDYFDREFEMPDTKETYETTIQTLEAKYPEFSGIFDKTVEYRKNNTHLLVEAGIYEEGKFQKMLLDNENYVSLKRIMKGIEQITGSGRGIAGAKKVVKNLKGGGEDIQDPGENDINNTFIYRSVAMRNDILRKLADMADSAEGMGHIMSKADKKLKATTFNAQMIEKQLEDMGIDTFGMDMDVMMRVFNPNYLAGPNQVVVYRDGKPEIYDVHPDLYESIANLKPEIGTKLVEVMMSIANFTKSGIIFTPKYLTYNMARDTIHNLIASKSGINMLDIIGGFVSVLRKDKYYKLAMSRGGTVNHFTANDRKFAQEAIDSIMDGQSKARAFWSKIKHPANAIQDLIEPTEMAGRVAELKKHLKRFGHSDAEIEKAIRDMRNLSIDFRMQGAWVKKLQYNRITNFFNSQMQGVKNSAVLVAKYPIRTTLKGLVYITLPTLALMYYNDDNDYYDELPSWRKDFFFNIPLGDPKTTNIFLPIPKPYELGLLYGALPERLVKKLKEKDPHAFDEFMDSVNQAIIPDITPSVIQPMLEDFGGVTWNGRPILSYSDKGVSPELQYNEYTSLVGRGTAQVTKKLPLPDALKSPKRIDHLIKGYGGTLGTVALDSIDQAAGKKDGIPVIGGLTKNFITDAQVSPQSLNLFYINKNKLDTAYNDSRKSGEKISGSQKSLRTFFSNTYEKISKYEDQKKVIEKSDDLSEGEKKLKITSINVKIIEMTREANKRFDEKM